MARGGTGLGGLTMIGGGGVMLGAGLGGQGKGQLFTARLTNDNLKRDIHIMK